MKKFAKLFALLLALCVIVGAFVLTSSAEDVNTTDPYRVGDTYYASWGAAVSAAVAAREARSDYAIYLNPNYVDGESTGVITVSTALISEQDVTLDLNGATLYVSDSITGAFIGANTAGRNFTLRGEGTIRNAAGFGRASAGGKLIIEAMGSGIDFYTRSFEDPYIIEGDDTKLTTNSITTGTLFSIETGSSFYVSGDLTLYPYNSGNVIVSAAANTTTEIYGASFIVENPRSTRQARKASNGTFAPGGKMFNLVATADVKISNSYVEMKHGDMFMYSNGTTATSISIVQADVKDADGNLLFAQGDIYTDISSFHPKNPTTYLDVDDSTIIASEGHYISRDDVPASPNMWYGALITFARVPVMATFDNCNLSGSQRAITDYSFRPSAKVSDVYYDHDNNAETEAIKVSVGACGITSGRVIFNNCNYETHDSILMGSPWLVGDYINVKWNGGVINLKTVLSSGKGATSTSVVAGYSHAYRAVADDGDQIDDDWFGVLLSNVYFVNYPKAPVKDKDSSYYAIGGVAKSSVSVIESADGYGTKVTTYASAFLPNDYVAEEPKAPVFWDSSYLLTDLTTSYDPVNKYEKNSVLILSQTTKDNVTTESISNKTDASNATTHKDYIALLQNQSLYGHGTLSNVISENGRNGYYKYEIKKDTPTTNDNNYIDITISGKDCYPSNKSVSSVEALGDTQSKSVDMDRKYIVKEFDIRSDPETARFPNISVNAIVRLPIVSYADGKFSTKSTNVGASMFKISPTGNLTIGSGSKTLATDGTWNRITLIYEINYTETTISLNGTSYGAYDFSSSKVHLYVDGDYVGCVAFVKSGWATLKSVASDFWIDAARFYLGRETETRKDKDGNVYNYIDANGNPIYLANGTTADGDDVVETLATIGFQKYDASVSLDNFASSAYPRTADSAVLDHITKLIATKSSLKGEEGFLIMPDNNELDKFVVDGNYYDTEDEAISAIKPGSSVELYDNVESPVKVDSPISIITNGNSCAGYISDSYVAQVYGSNIEFRLADSSEIYDVEFVSDDFDINKSGKASVGSIIESPVDLTNYPDPVNDRYIVGWTLISSGNVVTVTPAYDPDKDMKITAYPLTVAAAKVIWLDAEGAQYGDPAYYKPGEGVFAALPDGISTENLILNNGWFDYKVSYETALATELSSEGEYRLSPDLTAVAAKSDIANIKINVSVYTNFKLNIYIPTYSMPEEVSGLVFSTNSSGSNALAAIETTIEAKAYNKYSDPFGVAETDSKTYYIFYNVGGEILSKTITYGIPTYASAVMNDEAQPEKAKRLVMNMVNYACELVSYADLMGEDIEAGAGMAIYEGLLERYPSYVSTIADSEFLGSHTDSWDGSTKTVTVAEESGSIYAQKIAYLTYDDDNPNLDNNKKFKTWFDGISMLFSTDRPVFIIKYSDAAEKYTYTHEYTDPNGNPGTLTTSGIKRPSRQDGYYGWWGNNVTVDGVSSFYGGLCIYVGYSGTVGGVTTKAGPGRVHAYKGDIYTGTEIAFNSPDWDSAANSEANSYYVFTNDFAGYCDYNVYYMTENLSIKTINNTGHQNTGTSAYKHATGVNEGINVSYNLAAYINMLLVKAEGLEAGSDAYNEYRAAADVAKALYSYSLASREYLGLN